RSDRRGGGGGRQRKRESERQNEACGGALHQDPPLSALVNVFDNENLTTGCNSRESCVTYAPVSRRALVLGRIASLEPLSPNAVERSPIGGLMSRRQILQRATALGLGGLVLSALPAAE